jgi:DNA-binding transcriptional MerR regulator
MAKGLTQIAFDFFAPPVEEEKAAPPPPAELKPLLQKPEIIEIEEPEPHPVQQEEKIIELEPEAFMVPEPIIMEEEVLPVADTDDSNTIVIVESKAKKNGETRGRRSLKEKGLDVNLIEIPNDEVLFQRHYYPIGEVAEMFHENQSLIRYWETEFDILKPRKNGKGDRLFRPVDVKNIALIYDLLRRRKFTIQGAKDYLKNNKKAEEKFALVQSLQQMKSFFQEIKANL